MNKYLYGMVTGGVWKESRVDTECQFTDYDMSFLFQGVLVEFRIPFLPGGLNKIGALGWLLIPVSNGYWAAFAYETEADIERMVEGLKKLDYYFNNP